MPATEEDIFAGSREVVIVRWDDAAIAGRFPSARDGAATPAEGWFDAQADGQAVIDARGGLIGAIRRRFTVTAQDISWPDLSSALPCARIVDGEQRVDATALPARIEIDLEAGTTAFELFG